MTGDHDLFGDPAEPVPCDRAGCWCATYDRHIDGPLVDFGEWNPPGQPTLLGELCASSSAATTPNTTHATCPDPLVAKLIGTYCPVCWLVHPAGACDR